MTIIIIAHANSKQRLDEAVAAIKKQSAQECVLGLIELPGGVNARLGESTPKELYEEFCWHERVEVPGGEGFFGRSFYSENPAISDRQIYTTDPANPFINQRAEGKTWRKPHDYVDGAIVGIHFKNDKPVAVHLASRLGRTEFCKEFCIFLSDGSVLTSERWQ